MIKYISNTEHYSDVLAHCKNVKHSLWIGTADIKDAYIEDKEIGRASCRERV